MVIRIHGKYVGRVGGEIENQPSIVFNRKAYVAIT